MVDEYYGRLTARSQAMQEKYETHQASLRLEFGDDLPCPFCRLNNREIVEELGEMLVLRNNFPYEVYDGRGIKEHLMIVPRRHLANFQDFTDEEFEAYWRLQSKYHVRGYSSMTRSAIDVHRSVPSHLHTHLFFYFTDEP